MVELLMDLDAVLEALYRKSLEEFCKETANVSKETINKYRSLRNKPTLDKLSCLMDELPVSLNMGTLLFYVNSDNNARITSNAKKIFNLLALADSKEVDPQGIFKSRKEPIPKKVLKDDVNPNGEKISKQEQINYPEVFCYLDRKCDVINANKHFKTFVYLPGRSVSRRQIWELGKNRFGYDKYKINQALDILMEQGLVKLTCKGEKPNKMGRSKTDLFNLSVEGCIKYVQSRKK